MRKINVTVMLILFLMVIFPIFALGISGLDRKGFLNAPPEPRLLYPTSEEVNLTGKESLEFQWRETIGVWIDGYDFRLYKGYDMIESARILKQRLSKDTISLKINSASFEDGQVYTWSLKQIAQDGQKSDRSFVSFKVIKK